MMQSDKKIGFVRIPSLNRNGVSPAPKLLLDARASGGVRQRLIKDRDFAPCFSELSDFTHVTTLELSMENVHRLPQINVFSPDSRRAFLVNSDAADVFARMFENLRKRWVSTG
jgi:hypothetical protein